MPVQVKIDTCDFQKYGMIEGIIKFFIYSINLLSTGLKPFQ